MHGQFEVLWMVAKLKHEEKLARAQILQAVQTQSTTQLDRIAFRWRLRQWLGLRFVRLGCYLLANRQLTWENNCVT